MGITMYYTVNSIEYIAYTEFVLFIRKDPLIAIIDYSTVVNV